MISLQPSFFFIEPPCVSSHFVLHVRERDLAFMCRDADELSAELSSHTLFSLGPYIPGIMYLVLNTHRHKKLRATLAYTQNGCYLI